MASTEIKGASLPCPVDGCVRLRKSLHAMCWLHWRRLSKALQAPFWYGEGDWAAVQKFFKNKEK